MERQSYILCCLLSEGAPLCPGLHQASWRRPPLPQMYRRCLHSSLETHPHFLPSTVVFPTCFCRSAEDTSRPHACSHWTISRFILILSPHYRRWCFADWGVQAYSWGSLSSTRNFEHCVFIFGSPGWASQNKVPSPSCKTCFSIWIKVTFMADESVCSILEGKHFTRV